MAHAFARELLRTMTEAPALAVGLIWAFVRRRPPSVSPLREGLRGDPPSPSSLTLRGEGL